MKTLGAYLREAHSQGVIDHAVRANVDADGFVSFYIHPQGKGGDTLDFVVQANDLIPNRD